MNRHQKRKANAQGKPFSRLAVRGPNDPVRRSLMNAIIEAMEIEIPGTGPTVDRDRASILLSLCAAYVARVPVDQGRQKMLADIPTVFRDLVNANVLTAITADRFEEQVGEVTPEVLKAIGAQEQ